MAFIISERRDLQIEEVTALYQANQWSAVREPTKLYQALVHSHSLITAWDDDRLIGLSNAISDSYLVVYYPHLLIHPAYQKKGVGKMIMKRMRGKYGHFHMQILTADEKAVGFYESMGFVQAGRTKPMWIYLGNEH